MLADTSIVTVPLRDLKAKNFICFFRILTKDRTLTKKRFNNMKSVLNGLIYYAVEEGIVDHVKDNVAGMRYIPVTPTVKQLLVKIKEVNPESEYLF